MPAAGDLYSVGPDPIVVAKLCDRVAGAAYGAIATFGGTVRDTFEGRRVRHLEYEAFEPLCLEVMHELGTQLRSEFEIGLIAIAHRIGRLEVGELSVAIAVSAPHRRAALAACSEAIERVKRDLPVWKKEVFDGGEVWRENDVRSGVTPRAREDSG